MELVLSGSLVEQTMTTVTEFILVSLAVSNVSEVNTKYTEYKNMVKTQYVDAAINYFNGVSQLAFLSAQLTSLWTQVAFFADSAVQIITG